MIFFLFRTGAPAGVAQAGFRSMFAFWLGGGGDNTGGGTVVVSPTEPQPGTVLQRGGRAFTRKRFEEEILAAREARKEALDRAGEVGVKAAAALERAAKEAQKAIDAAAVAESADLERLTNLLDLAARAKSTTEIIKRAGLAAVAARAMAQKLQDDEDEAVALMLLS